MHRITRVELLLRVLTALCLTIAAVALLVPPRVPTAAVAPAALQDASPQMPPTRVAAAGDAVVLANIFSLSRRMPSQRYDPLTFGTEPSAPVAPPAVASPAAADDDAVPKLYGIVGGPNGGAALLRLDAALPGALLYRVGDRGGVYRVQEINEQSVVLSGPAGRIVLRLARQES